MEPALVWKNLFNIDPNDPSLRWQRFHEGVDIIPLHENTKSGFFCALLRYQPGAIIPQHEHIGTECLFILSGSQSDHRATYHAGNFLINPVSSAHAVSSSEGCVVLAIWEQPVRFVD